MMAFAESSSFRPSVVAPPIRPRHLRLDRGIPAPEANRRSGVNTSDDRIQARP
jgi:hypothetical protein